MFDFSEEIKTAGMHGCRVFVTICMEVPGWAGDQRIMSPEASTIKNSIAGYLHYLTDLLKGLCLCQVGEEFSDRMDQIDAFFPTFVAQSDSSTDMDQVLLAYVLVQKHCFET